MTDAGKRSILFSIIGTSEKFVKKRPRILLPNPNVYKYVIIVQLRLERLNPPYILYMRFRYATSSNAEQVFYNDEKYAVTKRYQCRVRYY